MNAGMKCWVFTCSDSPLEHWLEGYKQRFDAWEAGGVTGLVVGRMEFLHDDGSKVASWTPDPEIYLARGEEPPAPPPRYPDREK